MQFNFTKILYINTSVFIVCSEGKYMTSGLAISSFMPSIVSSGIFSSRRADKGIDALAANNPFVSAMNFDVAAGQVANAAKGVANIARESSNSVANGIVSAEEAIKNLSKADKFMNGVSKVVNFTADHINPLIVATGAVKVACSDDKAEAFSREALALSAMFGSEALAKRFIGMPKLEKDAVTGKKIAFKREGWYKDSKFLTKQAEAFKDYCATKKIFNKTLKFLPGALKGFAFVSASIAGYSLGLSAADYILKECGGKTNA